MSNSVNLSLDVTKTGIQNPLIKVRQGDGGFETLHTTVTSNGEPLDLQGWTITFMGTTAGNHKIVDGNVNIVEAPNGIFDYTPSKAWGMDIGDFKIAYFKFVKGDGSASSANFRVSVIEAVDLTQEEAQNYISVVDTTIAEINQHLTDSLSNVTQSIADANNNANTVASNVDTLGKRVNDYNNKLAAIKVGGRNYILNSKFSTAVDVPALQQSVAPSFYSNKQVTSSVYIKYDNVKTMVADTGQFKRVVFAVSFRDASGNVRYLDAQKNITAIGESFAGRVSQTIDLSGFNVVSMPTIAVFIRNFTADYVEASNPKLEIGNIATDWTPAPEDAPSNDAQLVHKTGTETIAGDKTFTSPINGQLATEPENLFFNSEFENSAEGWNIIAGGATFGISTGANDVFGHATAVVKLTSGYAKFGNTRLYPTTGNVSYSLSSLVNAGTSSGVYLIVDEFDANKTQIKSTPYGLTSSATWGLKTASFVTQVQTKFLQVTYQVGGSSGQSAYIAAPMWNVGTTPLPYVRGSEMQAIPDDNNIVHKNGTETISGDKTFTGNTTANSLVSNMIPVNAVKSTTSTMWYSSTLTAYRNGNVVTIVNNKQDTSIIPDNNTSTESIPLGYRPASVLFYPVVYGASLKGELQINANGTFTSRGAINGQYRVTATYVTSDAWPV